MKAIDDAFGSAGFRRVVLPGVVLTIGVHPLIGKLTKAALPSYGITEATVALLAEIILWGLVLSSSINEIYYIYEGIRFPFLTSLARRQNVKRLSSAIAGYDAILSGRNYVDLNDSDKLTAALVFERLADFPIQLSESGVPTRYAARSTMLGNIIATYEFYPKTRYHVDGLFYWFHFLAFAPEAATKEFNDNYGFAESLVLTSCAGAVVAAVNTLTLFGLGFGTTCRRIAVLNSPVSAHGASALAFFGLVVFMLFYLLSLPAHREVGRVFRTVADLSVTEVVKWATETPAPIDSASENRLANRKRYLNALK